MGGTPGGAFFLDQDKPNQGRKVKSWCPRKKESAQEYDQRSREREIRYLQRKAAKLGFTLSPSTILILAVS